MGKFSGTIGRRKINGFVVKHLQEALTWCNEDAYDKKKFATILNASNHEEMVQAVKKVALKMLPS